MNKNLELQKKTREANKRLVERWTPILDHKTMPAIKDDWTRINTARVLENMSRYLAETTFSGDIAQFAPILIPMVRRILPGLIANELCGVQPMPGPVSYVFGLRYGYAGENKMDPNMHSHYLDQGRMFKFIKSDPGNQVVGLLSGDAAVTGGLPVNQYEGKLIQPELQKFQPYGLATHNISVGDVLVLVQNPIDANANGPAAWGTGVADGGQSIASGTIIGAWKVITIMDQAKHHTFLTVAYPVGTLEQSETWMQRFKLAGTPDFDRQRNNDYKSGFFRRAVIGELDALKNTQNSYFFWARTQVDPFRIIQNDNTYQVPNSPYNIYSQGLNLNQLRIIAGRDGTGNPKYGPFTTLQSANFDRGNGYVGAQSGDNGIKLIEYMHPAEVGYNQVFQEYSGPYETHRGEMLGVNRERRKLGLFIEKQGVEARTRWLQGQYSIEAEQDLRAMHNIDLNSEYMNALSYEMSQDVDREILDRMFFLAETNQTNTLEQSHIHITAANMNQYLRAGITTGPDRLVDTYRRLLNLTLRMSNGIGKDTMRGNANFAVVSPNIAVMFEALQNFNMTNITGDVNSNEFAVGHIGTLNGNLKVYKDLLTQRDKDFILLGFKGDGPYDAGIFYCPYIPLQVEQTQGEQTFERVIGFQSRYDIADNLFGAENYYRLIELDTDVVASL